MSLMQPSTVLPKKHVLSLTTCFCFVSTCGWRRLLTETAHEQC